MSELPGVSRPSGIGGGSGVELSSFTEGHTIGHDEASPSRDQPTLVRTIHDLENLNESHMKRIDRQRIKISVLKNQVMLAFEWLKAHDQADSSSCESARESFRKSLRTHLKRI